MDFLTLAKERYSCRKFSGKEVEQEKLEKTISQIMCSKTIQKSILLISSHCLIQ